MSTNQGKSFGITASWDAVLGLVAPDMGLMDRRKAVTIADNISRQIEEHLNRFVPASFNDEGDVVFGPSTGARAVVGPTGLDFDVTIGPTTYTTSLLGVQLWHGHEGVSPHTGSQETAPGGLYILEYEANAGPQPFVALYGPGHDAYVQITNPAVSGGSAITVLSQGDLLLQSDDEDVVLSAAATKEILFKIGGTTVGDFDADGDLTILGDKFYMLADTDSYIQLDKAGGNNRWLIVNDGTVEMQIDTGNARMVHPDTYNNTTASGANMHISASGIFFRSTSLRRFKDDIREIPLEQALALLGVPAVSFYSLLNDENERRIPGFIAEDIEERAPLWATYDADYELQGVAYDRIAAGHHVVLQHILERLEAAGI